jgi:tetraacyldisaccharide 4'-kinase
MSTLASKVEAVMTGKNQRPHPALAVALSSIAGLYGTGVRLRQLLYRSKLLKKRSLPCTVISVGNITAGGTGKTPLTLYVARLLRSSGYKTVVVSRGYRGGAEDRGGIVSDGQRMLMDAGEAGDEPFLLALNLKGVPVIVGRDRYAAGVKAVQNFQPDIILLDDAFQHVSLNRDLDLVLLDYQRPLGNGHLIPRGMLREPPRALNRADALIFSRAESTHAPVPTLPDDSAARKPVFTTRHQPHIAAVIPAGHKMMYHQVLNNESRATVTSMRGKSCFAFSGIARNSDFRETLTRAGCHVKGFLEFPDHHTYTPEDVATILQTARAANPDIIVTTEKDVVRFTKPPAWPADVWIVGVELIFLDTGTDFDRYLLQQLKVLNGLQG